MTRWTFRILLCLLLGVVTTAAIACALCAWIDTPHMATDRQGWRMTGWYDVDRAAMVVMRDLGFTVAVSYGRMPVDEATWQRMLDGAPSLSEADFATAKWSGAWQARERGADYSAFVGQFQESIWDIARGWPRPAMRYRYAYQMGPGRTKPLITALQGILISDAPAVPIDPPPQFLPTRIVPLGFLINTAFYTTIWFTFIFGWRAHRRLIRRWQGYCPMCNYDLRAEMEQGCSECGWNRDP